MPRKPPNLAERIARIRKAGVDGSEWLQARPADGDLLPLSQRIQAILDWISSARNAKPADMLCFISYDIEHNKVRTQIAKYLIRMGCQRIQKSVYFAKLDQARYREIVDALREIQALYDNQDSVFFLPVGEDNLNRMQLIGRMLQVELAVSNKSTLFI
ncbi:MAG: CRISPR-associated endonuclease Cas2 [Bacteroidia bacterium]|nr:CRISPR-associated endonuclease Cas2 [Bacteroidia bacterium]